MNGTISTAVLFGLVVNFSLEYAIDNLSSEHDSEPEVKIDILSKSVS